MSSPRPLLTRYVIPALKVVIPLVIIAFLVSRIDRQTWQALRAPQDGRLLLFAFGLALLAVWITFVRWYLLVRALQLQFSFAEAMRLGFLSYLLNFVSVGAVGGDLFKAYFLARSQPGRRTEAVATVVVDRIVGLYALLIVTGIAVWLSSLTAPGPELKAIYRLTFVGVALGGAALILVLLPGFGSSSLVEFFTGLARVGPVFRSLFSAVRIYRKRLDVLAVSGLMSVSVHCLFALSIYTISHALFRGVPTLPEHFVIVPLSMVAGALPLTPAGLGTFEAAMAYLYSRVPAEVSAEASGITVALVFRALTIAIAAVGIVFYWTSRREVKQVLEQQ